jgi:predicted DCC family thiol-disulfide oxidoreductase YuxK
MEPTPSTYTTNAVHTEPASFILYDGECPVCRNYLAWTNLRSVRPDIALINARESPDLVAEYRRKGVEINDNMILRLGDLTLHGADALSMLTRLGEARSGPIAATLRFISRPAISRPLYPFMVAGRKALLFALRRGLI